jgi:hypothetical protein
MNSSVDILACAYDNYQLSRASSDRNVECVYYILHAFVVTQPLNPKIMEAARIFNNSGQGAFMTLDHVPVHTPISLEKLRNDTAAASHYMARLGTNLYVDYYEAKFYAEYEVVEIRSGLEVPLWVLVVSGIILIVSLILWQLTDRIIASPYRSSLYKIVAKRITSQTGTPVLLRAKLEPHEPLELEGVELLPGEVIQESDPKDKP